MLIVILFGISHLNASIASQTVQWLQEHGMGARLIILIISMLPIIELRGSIPVAILLFKMSWQEAFILSVIGNMLPIPFILLFVDFVFGLLGKFKHGKKVVDFFTNKALRKTKDIEKYELAGLSIFVGIPLPGTGGWTGALAAKLLNFSFWKAMISITIGVLIAGVIVTILSLMGLMTLA
jgi:uncharacterized membrane protein